MTDRLPQLSDAVSRLLSRVGVRRDRPPAPPCGRADIAAPPRPPPSPPLLNRSAGLILLTATLGLASCQAFIATIS